MSRKTNSANKSTDVKADTTVVVDDTNVDSTSVELTNEQVSDSPTRCTYG
ncbi:hypothetical protein ACPSKX_11520 [Moritella viscosa]